MATDTPTQMLSTRVDVVQAARAFGLPEYPASWYLFCASHELAGRPISKSILDKRLVAFRTESGKVAVMNARCVHMGSDLGRGRVVGEGIQCPFHNWEFGLDGQCTLIPATDTIPRFARQPSYPAEERHGSVFFFNGPKALFPLPFFSGCEPEELTRASPFSVVIECPWYMVGANAVDLQHFDVTHDRELKGAPNVDYPSQFAHRTISKWSVTGNSVTDCLTRWLVGDEVTLEMTDWAGTLMLVRATFPRSENFGMLKVLPLGEDRILAHVTAFVKRSSSRLRQTIVDPVNAWIRRLFIKKFLHADIGNLAGTRCNPHTLIEVDHLLVEYLEWLASLPTVLPTARVDHHLEASSDLNARCGPAQAAGPEQNALSERDAS